MQKIAPTGSTTTVHPVRYIIIHSSPAVSWSYFFLCACTVMSPGYLTGQAKHMSVRQFPHLITEVIRGTFRHQELKKLRSASERTNSSAKVDFCILSKPKIRGLKNAGILSQMAVIVVLLKRMARFIVKVTLSFREKVENNKSPQQYIFISGPKAPKLILNLIQRE